MFLYIYEYTDYLNVKKLIYLQFTRFLELLHVALAFQGTSCSQKTYL